MKITPYEKYMEDPKFHAVVDKLTDLIEQGWCDYHALQEASVVASVCHCQRHGCPVSPIVMDAIGVPHR